MEIFEFLKQLKFRSIVDVMLVAFLFYQIIAMLKGTRAAQVVIGMLVIFIAYAVSSLLQFETLYWLISRFYSSFIIVVIVLFQDDIRRLLTQFGRSPFEQGLNKSTGIQVIDQVINAAENMSHEKLGGIIVFERGIGLDRLYDNSVKLDSIVTEQLLMSVFNSFSPLHDGALIIQKNRAASAGVHLPLSKKNRTGKKLGTRHSAAVGISEETDAVVLVVSEETGNISISVNGELYKQPSVDAAKRRLTALLLPHQEPSNLRSFYEKYFHAYFKLKVIEIQKFIGVIPEYSGLDRRQRIKKESLAYNANNLSKTSPEHFSAIERENRNAASEAKRLSTQLPVLLRIKNLENTSKNFNINKNINENEINPTTAQNKNNEDDFANLPPDMQEAIEQEVLLSAFELNEAVQSLNQLSPQDKVIPPAPPNPPPRDVVIAGVSLNPPLENIDAEESGDYKKVNKEN